MEHKVNSLLPEGTIDDVVTLIQKTEQPYKIKRNHKDRTVDISMTVYNEKSFTLVPIGKSNKYSKYTIHTCQISL